MAEARRKISLSHLIAVIRTGELVEDVAHRDAVEEDGETAHGTVVGTGPLPEPEGRSHPADPQPGTLPRTGT